MIQQQLVVIIHILVPIYVQENNSKHKELSIDSGSAILFIRLFFKLHQYISILYL